VRFYKTDNSPRIPSVNLLFSIGDNAYMPIKYLMAPDVQTLVNEIVERFEDNAIKNDAEILLNMIKFKS